jgi:hypothetical protein
VLLPRAWRLSIEPELTRAVYPGLGRRLAARRTGHAVYQRVALRVEAERADRQIGGSSSPLPRIAFGSLAMFAGVIAGLGADW